MNILKVNQPKNRPKIEMFGIKKPLTHCKSGVKKFIYVVPLGLEPRLFCTKNRRVANYTMGQEQKLCFKARQN